jgi:metal-sulfur cluster biosynthetic enzyme/rhodanese-related sulfurtransferase
MGAAVAAVLAVLAVAIWRLTRRLRAAERQIVELRLLRHEIEEARDEAARELAVTRSHLAEVAAGEPAPHDTILRGLPFREVTGAEAVTLLERTPGLVVLDVRTPAEFASGHIPNARLVPVEELERRLKELPSPTTPMLVTCAAGGRSTAACDVLSRRGWTRLWNLVDGMHSWPGPRVTESASGPAAGTPAPGAAISFRGGSVSEAQVIEAIRQCFDPEIPLNIYDLGLIYGIDIEPASIAVRMTLTSEACPSAQAIPEDVRRKLTALGQPNVSVDLVWDPPWHPSRISEDGKQKLGLG